MVTAAHWLWEIDVPHSNIWICSVVCSRPLTIWMLCAIWQALLVRDILIRVFAPVSKGVAVSRRSKDMLCILD
jgi:hypothetical protein